jgi:hypothetical protein
MIKMRKILQVSLISFLLLAWGCGKKATTSLYISENPTSPYLIPQSTPVNDNPNVVTPTAPYFTMNSITLSWTGTSQFQLLTLSLYAQNLSSSGTTSSTSSTSFNCGGSGSGIIALFSGVTFFDYPAGCSGNYPGTTSTINGYLAVDTNGNLTIPPIPSGAASGCVISVRSLAFYCDSLPVTISSNPFATYNIPVQVIVFGESLDSNGNTTGRVNAIGNITVQ